MRTFATVAELRAALATDRRDGRSIGLVPTMGALHAGHRALIDVARTENDVVVVSVFVNPTQFDQAADLERYPRDLAADAGIAETAGADLLFAPTVAEVYPAGFVTTVSVGGLSGVLEGAARGHGHFDGVATVVTKLLNMVGPDRAYFGQKDAQQALVIRRLVTDLNLPVAICTVPTVREPDGVALSSRNVHLSVTERQQATALSRALAVAAGRVAGGERDAAAVIAAARAELDAAGVETEYFALTHPTELSPVREIDGPTLALVAARVGATRLIDNRLLEPVSVPC